jgi:hypothetical protein
MVSTGQITAATTSLARFFYKSGVALHLIEQPDLLASFAALGLSLPNRKQLANKMLDAEYTRVKEDVWAEIRKLPLLQLSTDGWRRNHCADGAPLINVMVLKPKGGSRFVKVEAARGVCKNAQWIEEQHLRWAHEVTEGDLSRMLGMVMDNTKVRLSVTNDVTTLL